MPDSNIQSEMTLRDWFAGQALPAIIAGIGEVGGPDAGMAAVAAYGYADEMMKERNQENAAS